MCCQGKRDRRSETVDHVHPRHNSVQRVARTRLEAGLKFLSDNRRLILQRQTTYEIDRGQMAKYRNCPYSPVNETKL